MQIKDVNAVGRHSPLESAYTQQDHSSNNTDVSFFNSVLEKPNTVSSSSASAASSAMLVDATKALSASNNRISKVLNSASRGVDLEKLRTFPLELSNKQLTSQLLVKSLAKTTQCVEKISNLQ
ncbi:EscI/YscI/HrpB family type III secretion system inner rod protein [Pseudomonas sp. SDO524_S393]